MEFFHMPKEFNGLSDRALNGLNDKVLTHWFPMDISSHTSAGKKTM